MISGLSNMFSHTLSSISRNLQNFRLEDTIRAIIPKPDTVHDSSGMHEIIDNEKLLKKEQLETEKNEEYLLSIHSETRRSRHRKHIRGKEAVLIINKDSVQTSSLFPDSREAKLFNDMANKHNIAQESVCFSGGGYNCMYHMGVVRYIFENPELFQGTKYLGASGGAGIVAVVLCFESEPNKFKILNHMIEDVIAMRDVQMGLHDQVKVYMMNLIKHVTHERFDRYIKDSDRCHISVTDVSGIFPRNVIKTKFTSYTQFIDTLKASACIPLILDDQIRKIDSRKYLDGGLSNNMPTINEKTLRISCLNYPLLSADLYPKVICDIKYCFTPPPRNYVHNMHDLGYNDIDGWLKEHKRKLTLIHDDRDLQLTVSDVLNSEEFVNDLNDLDDPIDSDREKIFEL